MKITVTQDDIDGGTHCNSSKCPIALAIGRKFPFNSVAIGITTCSIDANAYLLPKKAQNFIQVFDRHRGGVPEPFDFELDI